ncbi:DNA methyltransferase [Alphaproteobacteria bacterium LSUCC0684]
MPDAKPNALHYGDCLDILPTIPDASVDLIYLDPPFNSNANYNMLFGAEQGEDTAQIQAFTDTWYWRPDHEDVYSDLMLRGGTLGNTTEALMQILGRCGMLAYLFFMMQRLILMKRVLKQTGSIYLHCDPKASHYLKIIMDAVFGQLNFINEIIWHYQTGGGSKRWYAKKHDTILFYAMGEKYTFNYAHDLLQVRRGEGAIARAANPTGARLSADDTTKTAMSVWTDINALNSQAKERLGYPTQKPLALLNRIISASSNEGDVVLDPFCGCGTTVDAAEALGRRWIGIDISCLAINVILERLENIHGKKALDKIEVSGIPRDLAGAEKMFRRDPLEFERWAVGLIRGRPNDRQRGDGGSDGELRFYSRDNDRPQRGIISVKGGQTLTPSMVNELEGAVTKFNADMGVLITLRTPTRGMIETSNQFGLWEDTFTGNSYPRIQIITIRELLDGQSPNMPSVINPYLKASHRHDTQMELV